MRKVCFFKVICCS